MLHGCAYNAVQPRLIALPMKFEPVEHIDVETHRDLLLRRWPGDHPGLLEKCVI